MEPPEDWHDDELPPCDVVLNQDDEIADLGYIHKGRVSQVCLDRVGGKWLKASSWTMPASDLAKLTATLDAYYAEEQ